MKSILDPLEHWAAVHPDKKVSVFLDVQGKEKASYTYAAFSQRTRDLAEYLSLNFGLKYGERVLLAYPPGLDIVVALFACARLGVIPVPVAPPANLNFAASVAKLTFIAEDCEATAVLTAQGVRDSFKILDATLQNIPWVATDVVQPSAASNFRDTPSHILFLQYTSGSTADPRGVLVTHENILHNGSSTIDHTGIGVSWLPQYHDMGLIGYYLFPILKGSTTYGFAPFDFLRRPILWLQTISRMRATYASAPNFGFEYCLREDRVPTHQLTGIDLSSLRVLMNAAEPVRVDTYLRFLDRFAPYGLRPEAHVTAYGLAENTLAATNYGRRIVTVNKRLLQSRTVHIESTDRPNNNQLRLISSGRPLDGIHLRIVEPQSGLALREKQVGEIWLSGNSTCEGYWERPYLTSETFHNVLSGEPSTYLRTGDLGFLHEGELFVCGRVKDLIIIRGVNYYPQDIETIVELSCSAIRTGCVAAFNSDTDREDLIVIAEISKPAELPDLAAIARAIRIQYYIAPQTIVLVCSGSLVKTSSGKVARALTRRRWLDNAMTVIASYTATSHGRTIENSGLRQRFSYLTENYDLSGHEAYTFSEMGIDSLTMVQFHIDIKALLQERGAATLAEEVDFQLLQRLTVAQFFSLLDEFDQNPDGAVATWRHILKLTQQEQESYLHRCMQLDARLESPTTTPQITLTSDPLTNVLMTGPTGFFGPFLLSSLLQQTPYQYYVIVRATDPTHGLERIRDALRRSRLLEPSIDDALTNRVHVLCGDISKHNLGLTLQQWENLSRTIHRVCHNAALVNYVLSYEGLKPHNIEGTRELFRFCSTGIKKELHHISSTFIFGWTIKGELMETENNEEMANLDFGYSQTKWVSEQLVLNAAKQGLKVRIYRPALLSASTQGVWDHNDIALRLLAFMINHSVAVYAKNQISFLPADIVAHNIAAIFQLRETTRPTLHVTADEYYNLVDITRLLSHEYGYSFEYFDIPAFIAEMNRLCTREDPLYPLLGFFNQFYEKISAMQFKRYNNNGYREARERTGNGRPDPTLRETVSYLMSYMLHGGLIRAPHQPQTPVQYKQQA